MSPDPKQSKGTKIAAELRAECNNLTQEERDLALNQAVEISKSLEQDKFLAERQARIDKKNMETEKHLNTKLPITLENFSSLFYDWNDNARIEIIKSLIYTSADMTTLCDKVIRVLQSAKFQETLD